ncbi:MAG: lipoate--protein ligase family protein [Candidatus Omnitrophota bacterium]
MINWRLIISPANDAYTNMAIDESILQTYIYKGGMPTLRIYSWKPAAISLGSSQVPASALNLSQCLVYKLDFVRRITGGEAIFHDNEITYSIVCSKQDLNVSDSVKKSFRVLTAFVFNAYRELGLKPFFAGDIDKYKHGDPSEFCFATTEKFDIMIGDKKIGGNAQKRSRDIIFQHGSIPLTLDFPKIKTFVKEDLEGIEQRVTCLQEELKREISLKEISLLLIDSFKSSYDVCLKKTILTRSEEDLTHTLNEEKYKTKQWNYFKKASIVKKQED